MTKQLFFYTTFLIPLEGNIYYGTPFFVDSGRPFPGLYHVSANEEYSDAERTDQGSHGPGGPSRTRG